MLTLNHYLVISGHPVNLKLYCLIKQHFYWPSITVNCYTTYIMTKNCPKNRIKLRCNVISGNLFPAPASLESFSIDIRGELIRTLWVIGPRGHRALHQVGQIYSNEGSIHRQSFQTLRRQLGVQLQTTNKTTSGKRNSIYVQVLHGLLPHINTKMRSQPQAVRKPSVKPSNSNERSSSHQDPISRIPSVTGISTLSRSHMPTDLIHSVLIQQLPSNSPSRRPQVLSPPMFRNQASPARYSSSINVNNAS